MESFTGQLVGSLGGDPAQSPEFDALAREGLLLTHCYATGERTVQGLEAVISSFPPLPGVATVRRREASHGFATLASMLAQRGYESVFFYGGQGIFDHMRGFFLSNGFDDFIAFDAYDGQGWRQFGQSLDLSFELLAVPEPGVAGLVAGVMVLGMRRRAR